MSEPITIQPFDQNVKAFFRDTLQALGLRVETELETFLSVRTIDLVAECQEEDLVNLADTCFSYFRAINIIELKGPNDRLRIRNFSRIMSRSWAAERLSSAVEDDEEDILDEEDFNGVQLEEDHDEEEEKKKSLPALLPNERTITLICVVRPTKILDELQHIFHFHKTDAPGVYLSEHMTQIRIIHPDELDIIPENYPLLCLSRGKKLQSFIELCIQQELYYYLRFILTVGQTTDNRVIWYKLMEVLELRPMIQPETWGYVEEFFKEVPEAFESVPIIQQNFKLAQEKAHEQGIETGKVEKQRTNIIRMIHRKFGDGHDAKVAELVEEIEQLDDLDVLDEWFDRIFDANTLNELIDSRG
ncbi:MAG: hypothetical protein AAF639_21565 [Chloroflexota bacterium]